MSAPHASRSAVTSSLDFLNAISWRIPAGASPTIGSGWADVTHTVLAFIKRLA
jgi:hypothetical protein